MDFKKINHWLISALLVFLSCSVNAQVSTTQIQLLAADKQLFLKAVKLSEQGQLKEAELVYLDLIKRNESWPEPKNNLAIIFLKTERMTEAKEMLEQAVTSSRSYRVAQENRTQLYNYLATQAYDKALGANQQITIPEMEVIEKVQKTFDVIEKEVVKEVVKEVIKEVVKEVEVIKEVEVVKIVEKIIEKKVEVIVEKPVTVDRIVEKIVVEKIYVEKPVVEEISKLKQIAECETNNSVAVTRNIEQQKNVSTEKIKHKVCAEVSADVSADISNGEVSNRIEQQLLGWSRAWSQGDFDFYIKSYSEQFIPSDDRKNFAEWKNIRRGRLVYAKGVNVSFDRLRVFVEPQGDFVLAEFIQNYESASYSDKVLKQMYMQKEQNSWRILSERTIKTY